MQVEGSTLYRHPCPKCGQVLGCFEEDESDAEDTRTAWSEQRFYCEKCKVNYRVRVEFTYEITSTKTHIE